jgi:beta-glucosidase
MYRGSPWPANATARAQATLARMASADKYTLIKGSLGVYIGNVPGNATLGIPSLNLEDGPQGVADETLFVTAWPSAMTVAMAWDRNLSRVFGRAMAEEQHGKGTNIILAPAVCIVRLPWNGRVPEYLSEDPYLASRIAEQEVLGLQSLPVSATVKHWVLNQQEYERTTVSSVVDTRTFYELYVPPFAAAVDVGVGSTMCAYCRLRFTDDGTNSTASHWACEANSTLTAALKDRLGFRGFVMSDWTATHTAVDSALAGLDMEMPQGVFFGLPLELAVDAGLVPASRIDDMVLRILTSLYAVGAMDDPQDPAARNVWSNVTSDAHGALARELAEQSITLLQNTGNLLPVDPATITSVAVLGDETTVLVGGSGGVIPPYIVTPTQGIAALVGPRGVNVSTYTGQDPAVAAQYAAAADLVVLSVGLSSSEGSDRPDLSLPAWQDAVVAAAAAANKKLVVVVRCPGACVMPWLTSVPAVLYQLMPGQESGNALAAAIFGVVNPSGKLPISFPRSMNETWLSPTPNTPVPAHIYPGTDRGQGFLEADYAEGLLVGYKYYDELVRTSSPSPPPVTPLFPFGHGLSYTTFAYSGLTVNGTVAHDGSGTPATVSVTVTNTGAVMGAEVAQLYLGFPQALGEPPKLLRGFEKVSLQPGQGATITFSVRAQDAAYFDLALDDWACAPGSYAVLVGSSSQDIRLTGTLSVV